MKDMLETSRLILRPYEESDLPEYHRILSDKQNLYYLNDITTETIEDSLESLQEDIALFASGNARRFAVILKGESKLIGGVGYDITAKTPLERIGHMGWFILPEHQNKGYVTEAAKRVLEYAFMEDGCTRITTGCYSENIPTQRVIAKLGFKQVPDKAETKYHDGKMKERLEYSLDKSEA
jgi:ribosomal-protein-alanine N-acetyltransferase